MNSFFKKFKKKTPISSFDFLKLYSDVIENDMDYMDGKLFKSDVYASEYSLAILLIQYFSLNKDQDTKLALVYGLMSPDYEKKLSYNCDRLVDRVHYFTKCAYNYIIVADSSKSNDVIEKFRKYGNEAKELEVNARHYAVLTGYTEFISEIPEGDRLKILLGSQIMTSDWLDQRRVDHLLMRFTKQCYDVSNVFCEKFRIQTAQEALTKFINKHR